MASQCGCTIVCHAFAEKMENAARELVVTAVHRPEDLKKTVSAAQAVFDEVKEARRSQSRT